MSFLSLLKNNLFDFGIFDMLVWVYLAGIHSSYRSLSFEVDELSEKMIFGKPYVFAFVLKKSTAS